MAIRKCPECGSDCSTRIPACIRCGFRFEGSLDFVPSRRWGLLLDFARTYMYLGALVAIFGGCTGFWVASLPGVVVFLVGFLSAVVGRYMDWRGGSPCQACGCRNTRSWTDGGQLFSVCEECYRELLS